MQNALKKQKRMERTPSSSSNFRIHFTRIAKLRDNQSQSFAIRGFRRSEAIQYAHEATKQTFDPFLLYKRSIILPLSKFNTFIAQAILL
jgi:hypothetical protein